MVSSKAKEQHPEGGETITPPRRYHRKQQQAKRYQRRKQQERLAQEQARAQGDLRGLEQALQDLGIPDPLAEVGARERKAQGKLLGKLLGLMFPPLFGCQRSHELSRVRGWDKNLPSRILRALPKRKGVKQGQPLGQEMLAVLGQHGEDKSPTLKALLATEACQVPREDASSFSGDLDKDPFISNAPALFEEGPEEGESALPRRRSPLALEARPPARAEGCDEIGFRLILYHIWLKISRDKASYPLGSRRRRRG